MSSFMMKAESIATIADFISTVFNDKNNNTHMAIQGDTYTTIEKLQPQNSYIKTVSIKAVYVALSEMNCNALNQRYIHDDKAEPDSYVYQFNYMVTGCTLTSVIVDEQTAQQFISDNLLSFMQGQINSKTFQEYL